jgi:hypothetical protein
MKLFRFVATALLLCGQVMGASSVSAWVQAMHADDYAARLAAINALESRIAHASAPAADAAQRAALERELLAAVADPVIPELSRAYVLRLLPPIASQASVQPMLQMVMDPKTSRLLGNDAAGLLAAMGNLVDPDTLVKSLVAASDSSRALLWSAVALRADPRLAPPLVKALQSKQLPLNELGIQALGDMGGREVVAYLMTEWKQAGDAQRTMLARAIVHTGAATAEELQALCLGSKAPEIRVAALRQWATQKETAALDFLQAQVDAAAVDSNALIAGQLASGGKASWDWVAKKGAALPEGLLITILQSIREQQRKDMEPWVLARLEGAAEAVEVAAVRCLAVIGGGQSSDALSARIQSRSKKVAAEALNALAVLKDSALDGRLQAALGDPQNANYVTALELISLRNGPGSSEFLNRLFSQRSLRAEELAAGLRGMERIGNIDSVKLLLARLRTEKDAAVVRAIQISLKRLVIRLEQAELVWQQAFLPALTQPANAELQMLVLPIMDAVASPAALAFCVERVKGADAALAGAAEQALIRWRGVEVCDYWLSVVNDPGKSAADRDQAIRLIDLTLRADVHSENPSVVAEKTAALFLGTENKELRDKLIAVIGGLSNRWKSDFHKAVTADAKNLQAYRAQLDALVKKDGAATP